jgi:hypothetical protein
MRFNPPTSWPAVPAGWAPPAGWMPDPSWPPAPAAWPFWLSDEGVPLPSAFAPGVPAWDPRAVAGDSVAAGSWPVATPPVADDEAARHARRGALVLFGIGVVVFLAGAGSAIVAGRSVSGGWIWTGGMLVGASMFIRALTQYRGTKAAGPAKPRSIALVAIGLLLCVGAGIGALVSSINPAEVPHDAGSCWTVTGGDNIQAVPCSEDHKYKVSQTVDNESACPDASSYYVKLDSGKIGCLVDD